MQRVALITGILGQDGTLLADFLAGKGYIVHGTVSAGTRCMGPNLHYADLVDGTNLIELLDEIQPDEVYNLAAQSRVRLSFELPVQTANVTGMGPLRMLEAIRQHQARTGRQVRFFQASSSEMFGRAHQSPQNEQTPFFPRSPYACAKLYAHYQTINYREAYGMFTCSGILFNHESLHRDETYVTRKITRAAARIKLELQDRLLLGNVDARRDWGFAGDYVEAMWLMMSHDRPDDYVIATGESHSVREFISEVFACVGLDWKEHVDIDERLKRPLDAEEFCGDSGKARRELGWQPKVNFQQLVRLMTDHDIGIATREKSRNSGERTC